MSLKLSRQLIKELTGYGRVHRVQFSPDGRVLAVSATPSGRTELFDAGTWRKLSEFNNGYAVGQMSFSPDSKMIATGGCGVRSTEAWKTWVRVWDVATGEMLMEFKEMQNAVSAVAISPDSRYLIAVGGDQGNQPNLPEPIRIWDLDAKRLVAEFDGHDRCVRGVVFAPDGKHFATVSNGVKVWNLEDVVGSPTAGTRAANPSVSDDIKEAKQLESHADIIREVAMLPDAALFGQIEKLSLSFPPAERATAEKLLKKAQVLEPNNPEWSKRLGQLYRIAMKGAVSDARREFAEKSALQFRRAVELLEDPSGVYYILADFAEVSLESGRHDEAITYATKLLEMATDRPGNWYTGNAIHHGNLVLGRLALLSGDTEKAKSHLLAAGRTPGSPQLNSFGPNMTLAKALVGPIETDLRDRPRALGVGYLCAAIDE